ncbi:MAG: hypothetical protein P4L50_24325 [Anaerolineaceae bacterium]|nr:hypothetical protein [Anaerolineaceae bacterium]
MALYQCSQPQAQVRGEFIIPMIESAGPFQDTPLKILADNGIDEPQPGEWYSYQAYLNALKAVATRLGPATLFLIGKWMVEDANWPKTIESPEKALEALDSVYRSCHRGDNGSYKVQKIDDKNVHVVCQTPYPEDIDRGLIETLARKYRQNKLVNVRVRIDLSQPCKSKGANTSTCLVSW